MKDEVTKSHIDRRIFVGGAAGIAALAATGARAQRARLCPNAPVALNVIDVGGALALMQKAFEELPQGQARTRLAHHLRQGPGAGTRQPRSRRSRMPAASTSTWC